eukprot:scaffold3964_cov126-Isochrysis_galbana.AAC.1
MWSLATPLLSCPLVLRAPISRSGAAATVAAQRGRGCGCEDDLAIRIDTRCIFASSSDTLPEPLSLCVYCWCIVLFCYCRHLYCPVLYCATVQPDFADLNRLVFLYLLYCHGTAPKLSKMTVQETRAVNPQYTQYMIQVQYGTEYTHSTATLRHSTATVQGEYTQYTFK